MSEYTKELQDRFADAAIALMMEEFAQEDGDALLTQYRNTPQNMPDSLDQLCQKAIQRAHKCTLMGSTLKRAAHAAACFVLCIILLFPLVMSVEAFRVPAMNFILKHGKGFTEITFSQDSSSFTALDKLREIIWPAIPEGYQFELENISTAHSHGVESVSSLLIRFTNDADSALDIHVMKAAGTLNIDSQDSKVIPMVLSDQQAVFVAGKELRVLWINDEQGQLYSVTGYDIRPDDFWKCVHALTAATKDSAYSIRF